jgi:hypothetical protein
MVKTWKNVAVFSFTILDLGSEYPAEINRLGRQPEFAMWKESNNGAARHYL